jgi:hypothetical protein
MKLQVMEGAKGKEFSGLKPVTQPKPTLFMNCSTPDNRGYPNN